MIVEYSFVVYLKSGTHLVSDPIEVHWETAQQLITDTMGSLSDQKYFQVVRNGRMSVVFVDSIEYIEFITDEVRGSAAA